MGSRWEDRGEDVNRLDVVQDTVRMFGPGQPITDEVRREVAKQADLLRFGHLPSADDPWMPPVTLFPRWARLRDFARWTLVRAIGLGGGEDFAVVAVGRMVRFGGWLYDHHLHRLARWMENTAWPLCEVDQ